MYAYCFSLIIEMTDSKSDCVHASFEFGQEFANVSRESMEIRMFVFSK
jgi:hypothetical protein